LTVQLSDRIKQVQPSLTLGITAKAKQLKAEGIHVISFGAGEPDFDTPEHIKEATIQSLKSGFTKYTPASGIPELKKVICDKIKADQGVEYASDQIVVSCGAKHTLYNIFQVLLNPGDEVIIPSPFWLSYPEMVTLAEGKSVIVPTTAANHYLMSPEALTKAITKKTKVLVLNSPSNPTGMVYSKEKLQALLEVARKHHFYIISDEIYEKLIFDGLEHISPVTLAPDLKDRILLVNGFSKVYAMTGWRLGYVAAAKELSKAIGNLQSHSTSNPTSFVQQGGVAALQGSQEEVEKRRQVFEKRRDLICQEIDKVKKLSYVKPQGAFYIFCDIEKTGYDSMTLSEKLLDEARVAVVPGVVFGDDKTIRLSFALSEKDIVEGIKRIGDWLAKN